MSKNAQEIEEEMAKALETAASQYGKHSGPSSTPDERAAFANDLRSAALRYARAYYVLAREYGLIPAPLEAAS